MVNGEKSAAQAYMDWQTYAGIVALDVLASPVTTIEHMIDEGGKAIDAAQAGDWERAAEHGSVATADVAYTVATVAGIGAGVNNFFKRRTPALLGQEAQSKSLLNGEEAANINLNIDRLLYRGGGSNPGSLILREGESALSFRDSMSNPLPPGVPVLLPGKPFIGVDASGLPVGSAVPDGIPGSAITPPGHVSVYVGSPHVIKAAIREKGRFEA